jgi:predicted SnoaL-like aldol condensation-catalyzing enzyme
MSSTTRRPETAAGGEGLLRPGRAVDVEVHRVIAEGDLVAVHSHYKTWNMAGVDIFRIDDDGKIIVHWDVLQQVPEAMASGNDMFSQLS